MGIRKNDYQMYLSGELHAGIPVDSAAMIAKRNAMLRKDEDVPPEQEAEPQ